MKIPRAVVGFNKAINNRVQGLYAWVLPPWAVILHRGRRSGRAYRTPLLAFRRGDDLAIALLYGEESDWLRNLRANGGGRIVRAAAPSSSARREWSPPIPACCRASRLPPAPTAGSQTIRSSSRSASGSAGSAPAASSHRLARLMRLPHLLALALSCAALALPACGGDDEGDPTSGTSGTSGAQGAATDVSAIDMTAKEFNDATIPDEVATVDKLAAANPTARIRTSSPTASAKASSSPRSRPTRRR